ncbi:MAG: glucosamine-6-phosphate deaminase [Fuerstiella sp.]
MKTVVSDSPVAMGQAAAEAGADAIKAAIKAKGRANIIVATGASQLPMLDSLVQINGIEWDKVTGFHLDEYLGIDDQHAASFCGYLRDRFVQKVPIKFFHYVNGLAEDPVQECQRLGQAIAAHPIDVAFIGIGENSHIAFNDPPADFETETPYLVVNLDNACRRQQHSEGWFPTFDDVPATAISMSPRQILKSSVIICTVPDERKAVAVAASIEGPVTNTVPASILQTHDNTRLFIDTAAASQLTDKHADS